MCIGTPLTFQIFQDLVWSSKIVCSACCFLALACALRAFRGARDVLVPGQVTLRIASALSSHFPAQNPSVVVSIIWLFRFISNFMGIFRSRQETNHLCRVTVRAHADQTQVVTIFGLQSSAGTHLNGAKGQVQRFHAETGRFMATQLGWTDRYGKTLFDTQFWR